VNLSRETEAYACYERALAIDPDSVDARTGLALACEKSGNHDRAIELITPLLDRNIRHAGLAQVSARLCKRIGKCREAVGLLEAALTQPRQTRSARRSLHFTAGKLLDSLGEYDQAFAHFRSGNELATPLYDAVGNAQLVSNLINTFTRATLMGLPHARAPDKRLLFIVGMPRSGTSLTEQILAAHPQVHGAGELTTMTNIIKQFPHMVGCGQPFPACIDRLRPEHVDRMAAQYLEQVDKLAGPAPCVTDKFPHNFHALGLIELLFPGSRIIHCRRDPLDTGLSVYFQDFLDEHDYARDLFNIGIHFHQYRRLMQHWRQVLSLPMLDLDYEALVTNQEATTRRLLEFCGLDWNDACLQFHNLERHVNTASYDQVRQPIYTRSIGRWRHYEQYLDPLREGLERGH